MVFKKNEKMTWEYRVFQRMDDFLIKYGYENIVFFGEWRFFWQNIGMRAVIFSWKIGKKEHRIDFFGPWYSVVLTELTIILIKYVYESRGFSWKIWKKMRWEYCFFERMDVFLTKYRHESIVFFREWRFFYRIWAWEQ